ncbi:MAG: gliding motility-associated C-terminal domain-containing protein [Bacteroidetes bacterium]|nr:gliding motility-associated C-terminal domain-containing protein [Bacteroidota bacterium]
MFEFVTGLVTTSLFGRLWQIAMCLVILTGSTLKGYSQNKIFTWYFGANAGMDFSSGSPVVLSNSSMYAFEGCSAMSDSNGLLLFYSDGITVWDSTHNQMPNGTGLFGNPSSTQSGLIVPEAGNDSIYYLFTADSRWSNNGFNYSSINMNLNSGKGDVFSKNNFLFNGNSEKLDAIANIAWDSIWVVSYRYSTQSYYAYLVSSAGISAPVISAVGVANPAVLNGKIGQIKFSPNGNKLVAACFELGLIHILNFDFSTGGITSNTVLNLSEIYVYGASFSPYVSKLYVSVLRNNPSSSGQKALYQFDLQAGSAAAILASKVKIYDYPNINVEPSSLQLGPDCRIYVAIDSFLSASTGGTPYLGVINDPDETGLACNYNPKGIFLNGNMSRRGLTNFIENFALTPLQVSTSITLCKGDTVTLRAIGGNFIWWANIDSPNDTLIVADSLLVSPDSTTSYIVSARYGTLCEVKDTIRVIVDSVFVDLGPDTVLCGGASLILDVTNTGASYLWHDGSTDSTFTVLQTDTHIVQLTKGGCSVADSVYIEIVQNDLTVSNDTSICPGECVQLLANGSGTFTWSPGATLNDSTTPYPTACPILNTTYHVTSTVIYQGTSLLVNGDFESGNTGFTSDYSYGGGSPNRYVIDTDPNVYNGGHAGNDHTSGSGKFLIGDGSTLANKDVWCQTVSVTPNTDYIFSAWVCNILKTSSNFSDPNIQFYVNGNTLCSNVVIPELPDIWINITCVWNSGSDTVAELCARSLSTVFVGNDFGIDDIFFGDTSLGMKCTFSDSVNITLDQELQISIGPDTLICKGDTIFFQTSGGAQLYNWSPGQLLNDSTIASPFTDPDTSVLFIVNAMDSNGCTASDSVLVSVISLTAYAGKDTSVCQGDSVLLSGSGGTVFNWSPGTLMNDSTLADPSAALSASSMIILTVSDTNGCQDNDTMMVTVSTVFATAGVDTNICIGDSINITAFGAGNFSWTPNVFISDTSNYDPDFYPDSTITYYLTVTDTIGCKAFDSLIIRVDTLPVAKVLPPNSICPDESIMLNAFGGDNYMWSPEESLDDASIPNPIAQPKETTTYNVIVSNKCGSDSAAVMIVVLEVADIETSPDTAIYPGNSVDLYVQGAGTYQWSPDIGLDCTACPNPISTPLETIMYYVQSLDVNGCEKTDSVLIEVIDDSFCDENNIFIPNAFTPNNDGNNDILYAYGNGLKLNVFRIYNRWGDLVFETNDVSTGWDGKQKGKDVNQEVFVYYLDYNCNGKSKFIKGNVTVIR